MCSNLLYILKIEEIAVHHFEHTSFLNRCIGSLCLSSVSALKHFGTTPLKYIYCTIINCVLKLKSLLCPQTVNELNRGNAHLVVFAPVTAEGFSPVCRNGQPTGSRFHIPNSQCPIPYSNRDEHQFSSVRPLNLIKSHKISHIISQFAISAESTEP